MVTVSSLPSALGPLTLLKGFMLNRLSFRPVTSGVAQQVLTNTSKRLRITAAA